LRPGLIRGLFGGAEHRGQKCCVDFQRGARSRRSEVQGTLDFAASHCSGDALTELAFRRPKLLGEPKTHFQEAVIDRF